MDFLAPRRTELMARYDRLRPVLQSVLQVCSLIHGPTEPGRVFRSVKGWRQAPHWLKDTSREQIYRYVHKLQELQLLDSLYHCDPDIIEIVTRKAAATDLFQSMSDAVVEAVPFPRHGMPVGHEFEWVSLTRLRTHLYRRELDQIMPSYNILVNHPAAKQQPQDPLVQICNNPFDADWFSSYPGDFQCIVLRGIILFGILNVIPHGAALDYALTTDFSKDKEANVLRPSLEQLLAVRLMLAGRLEEASQLSVMSADSATTHGLLPTIEFFRGRHAAAVTAFERELTVLKAQSHRKNAYFHGWPGVFFLLALLHLNQDSALARMEEICQGKRGPGDNDPLLLPIYRSIVAIVRILRYDFDSARSILNSTPWEGQGKIGILFYAIARYWLDGTLERRLIDELSQMFIDARGIELHWVVMELAELLCRTEQETPLRRRLVQEFREATGAASLVAAIKIEEPWRRALRSLVNCVREGQPESPAANSKRLIWLMDYNDGQILLTPREQTLGASGTWTRGRPLAMKRVYEGKMDYLTRQDHQVRAALTKNDYLVPAEYRFDLDKVMVALIGHPLVFLQESPTVPVEIVRGEPELTVTREGSQLSIALAGELPRGRVMLVRETPTRFKVIEFNNQQLKIAKTLGYGGLKAPVAAKDEVLEAVSTLSSQVMVHSAVGSIGGDVPEVPAAPTPHVHLLPAGTGFTIELFVRPFGAGGPYLKAGVGAPTVLAEIDGKRRQTRRDLAEEQRRAQAVETACPLLADLPETEKQWLVREPDDCLEILTDLKVMQDRGEVTVFWPEGEKLRVSRPLSFDQLHLKVNSKTDWFELSGELRVDDSLVVDMKRLLELTATARGRFIPLGEGQFLALTEQLRKRLSELEALSQRRGKSIQFHPLAALALEDLAGELPHFAVDAAWQARLREIHEGLAVTPAVPSTFKAELRDYQVVGYTWLMRLAQLGFGACLADDMGLGKTIQALAVFVERSALGPALVVAPTSVCMNWHDEAARFAPTLRMVAFTGNDRANLVKNLGRRDLLVCSYGLLHQEAELLSSIQWSTIVLDEAQAIKNVTTKRARAAMDLNGGFRMITTGTPIENHLGEFWSLFNFINPGLLGSLKKFTERFALPIEKYQDREARKRLKKLIQPFILRRTKSQVLEELPARTEVTLQVEMQETEAVFYEALRQQALDRLDRMEGPFQQQHLKILAEITRLRQAACNSRLISAEAAVPSAKLELFLEVIDELLENRHKALVFSQFVGHLTLLREALEAKGIPYRYLDGSTPARVRKQEVDAFQSGQGDLFLISLKAGGLGLNLTAADYVIHMDPWWNPAVEDQASDRAHRIGQLRPVTVYRLVVRNTIEEKIVKLHAEKRDLAGSLLAGSDVSGKISAEELLQLIRG